MGYEFTANLEEELDVISAGDADYKKVLAEFWRDFHAAVEEASELRIAEVLDKLDEALAPQLYPRARTGQIRASAPNAARGGCI